MSRSLSSAAHRTLARARLIVRIVAARARGRPLTLSHLVTGRCNGRCPTCLWRDPQREELDTAAVEWLYDEAGRAGFAELVVWGGEPLLRDDLPALLTRAKASGLSTTLISNGWLIGERWPALRGRVDALILSLDDVGAAHDRLRGLPGLSERLEAFVEALGHDPLRPTLLVNTVLSRLNVGALARVAPVAKRWGAGLYFCPMETGNLTAAGFVARHDDLALSARELRSAAWLAGDLKTSGYPVLNTRLYLDLLVRDPALHGYTCRMPRALLTVEADGAIRDCLRSDHPLAFVPDLLASGDSLSSVFFLARRRELLLQAASCTKCNNPDVIELSWLWDMRPAMVRKVVELAKL